MDAQQQSLVFRAIAVSSLPGFSSTDRQAAFSILQDLKLYDSRIPLCLSWLQKPQLQFEQHDITLSVKLLALDIIDTFLVTGYAQCSENDRLELRRAILVSALVNPGNTRVLSRKLSAVLKGLILRDFPQRWTDMHVDLFQRLWPDVNGRNVVLEAFRLVAEDCVDGDFNSKISTTRRTDVVKGLKEIASHFLPLFFNLLETSFPDLQQSKSVLHNMHSYLAREKRTVQSLRNDERTAHQTECTRRDTLIVVLQDTLGMLESLCLALPTELFIGDGDSKTNFLAAFLHFFREPSLQVQAVKCVTQLVSHNRIKQQEKWKQLLRDLPVAFDEANQVYVDQERGQKSAETQANGTLNDTTDALVDQFEYHCSLARLLSSVLSTYTTYLTEDTSLLQGRGSDFESTSKYLRLMVSMLQHPSGRIAGEQVVMWSNLCRYPKLCTSDLLKPFAAEVLSHYMKHTVKIRWEDVENETHSHTQLMETAYEDEEEYYKWMSEFRTKANTLFRHASNHIPAVATAVAKERVISIMSAHSTGSPEGFLDPKNKQLTRQSEAVIQFEALVLPLEGVLFGMPEWAISESAQLNPEQQALHQWALAETRAAVKSNVGLIASTIVDWSPSYVELKIRHAALLETIKHYWRHEPSTLLKGVDTLIRYLGLPDEWNPLHKLGDDMSDEIVGLKKRSGSALVSVAKAVPNHLVPWLTQLSSATKSLLSADGVIPPNQMHLYEFLSCVAAAVDDPQVRASFIADVLSDAIKTLESVEVQDALQSTESLLTALGIVGAAEKPHSVSDEASVALVVRGYYRLFNPLNRILSVGRRCHEAKSKKTILGGVPVENDPPVPSFGDVAVPSDEGPLTIEQLSFSDPFIPLWPRILPIVLAAYKATLGAWTFEVQTRLLQNNHQRYAYAISDDDAYLATKQNGKAGGVFGESGTAGSVITGLDRRMTNLLPKWSGWLTELRNTCFQLIGLLATQRVLFSPEFSGSYSSIVSVLADPQILKSMDHRQMSQFMKQVIELLLVACPVTLYASHVGPIIGPVLEHLRYRLEKTWLPILSPSSSPFRELPVSATKALRSDDCGVVPMVASRGEEFWFDWYYAHAGAFVGELSMETSEAYVEKQRANLCRTFSDVAQVCLALRGDWALVLANFAREVSKKKSNGNKKDNGIDASDSLELLNANGTPRLPSHLAIDQRKLLRINGLCRFLLLQDERCAANLTLASIQSLCYPDTYSCRRMIKVCHRIIETVAWYPQYAHLLGQHMFSQAVKNIVTEPKWMVGLEWDMINLVRDIYCRTVLGQWLQFGGQGPAQQQPRIASGYEQTKSVDKPLQGGGILVAPSDLARRILVSLPSISESALQHFDAQMNEKRSAKDQKDIIRDLLRSAADNLQPDQSTQVDGLFSKVELGESLLHVKSRPIDVPDIPEKLIIRSNKNAAKENETQPPGLNALFG